MWKGRRNPSDITQGTRGLPFSCLEKEPPPAAGEVSLLTPLSVAFEVLSDLEDAQRREEEWCGDVGCAWGDTGLLCPGGWVVKNPPASAGDADLILGLQSSSEKEMATHSDILAWRILWTGSLVGCIVHGVSEESDVTEWLDTHTCAERKREKPLVLLWLHYAKISAFENKRSCLLYKREPQVALGLSPQSR